MSGVLTDNISLAIVLRLHDGSCSLEGLADDLATPSEEIITRLNQLATAGIVRAATGLKDSSEPIYALAPGAFRAAVRELPAAAPSQDALRPHVELLASTGLFATLSETTLMEIARRAQPRAYPAGAILFIEGDDCRGMYVVEEGLIRIFKQGTEPGRELTVRLMGPGDTFNEVPIFDGGPNPVTAEVIEDSRLLLLPSGPTRQLLNENPELARAAMIYSASRVRHMLAMVHDLAMRQVPARVAKILLQSIGPDTGVGAGSEQRKRLTQREIAEMAGTAREVVARTLKDLERRGIIAIDRGRITILDPSELAMML